MAKVTIIGNTAVVASEYTHDVLKTVAKYRPEILTLYKGEGKEAQAVFSIAVRDVEFGTLTKNGAVFSKVASTDGKALITLTLSDTENPAKEFEETYGGALLNLEKIEAKIATAVEDIEAEKALVMNHITVI